MNSDAWLLANHGTHLDEKTLRWVRKAWVAAYGVGDRRARKECAEIITEIFGRLNSKATKAAIQKINNAAQKPLKLEEPGNDL